MLRKIMISAPYMQLAIDAFRSFFNENNLEVIIPKVQERLEEGELLDLIGEIDGVICGDDRFTAKVLNRAKKLKVIAKWGTGTDSIDREEALKLGIAVCNTPNAFTEPVADTVLGYMLSFARRIPWSTNDIKNGLWRKKQGITLGECVLGVVGVGNIGKAVIRRAKAFGMKTIGNDISRISEEFLKETGTEMKTKKDLLKLSDFVTLNCDLNPTSHHLMGDDEFQLMKPTAYIINTARGPIINEKALIKALKKKQIAGAGLDVFEKEPLPKNSPLRKMNNCLLAPHNANSSPAAWAHVHQNTLNNLLMGLISGRRHA
ncbi:phosphoglycerate dehydrogenase [Candidatus Saganbacteria bacterium]|nr:phosphoglycerate dehydrogenase [Candidatus Saganbacteria bacterium]